MELVISFDSMSKTNILTAVWIVFFLLGRGDVFARQLRLFAQVGTALPAAEPVRPGPASGFGAGLRLHKGLWLQLDYRSWINDVGENTGFELFTGRLHSTPFLLGLDFELLPEGRLSPVLKAGAGYMFNRFFTGNVITIPEITLTQSINNGLTVFGGGGLIIRITEKINLNLEVCGFLRKAGGTTTINDMNRGVSRESFSVSLNTLILQAGITYFL